MHTTIQESFLEVLRAEGRSRGIPPEDDVYGWLIGGWDMDVFIHDNQDNVHEGKGEVHFSWVLEGRAVQDIWIYPRRAERGSATPVLGDMYGTTLRIYDASIRAWRVTWLNPVSGARDELVGRKVGDDIVQEGQSSNGARIRWSFRDITPASFRWLGERWDNERGEWRLQAEFRVRRIQ